jgi:hypothetical protein
MTEIEKVQKKLDWYKADADTGVIQYPYSEGDNYWTIKIMDENSEYEDNVGFFQYGAIAIQSCWDDQSEELYEVNPESLADEDRYFDSLEEVLKHLKYDYDFVKVSCFDSEMPDIKTGDYFVCEDLEDGKFQKSY